MGEKKKKAQLPFRLNIVFLVVFLLFTVLIIQLGIVQIRDGESYQEQIEKTIQDVTYLPVPRGKIYDRNHNILVDNDALYSITYTPPKNIQAKEKLEVAKKLAEYISMDSEDEIEKLTDRDKKEYWYLENEEEVLERVTEEETEDLDASEEYQLLLKRITDEEIADISKEELEIVAIKKEMDKAYALAPHIIKGGDVTIEEYSRVAEHLDELDGINAMVDWDRKQVEKDVLTGIVGSITSRDEGIPLERRDYFLTRGYNRNDRVGKSGLEEQYENLLRGRKEQVEYTTNKANQVVDQETLVEGMPGKDLILTIDLEYQKRLDELVRKEMNKLVGKNRHMKDALVVVMKPKTGEILALSGQHYNRDDGKFEDAPFKNLYDAHRAGSTVKGATVLAGYDSEVIKPGQRFYDSPIKIRGTPTKRSWQNMQWVDDTAAIQRSSNVYMFYIALRMGGEYGTPKGGSVKFNAVAFQKMRNYYHQFGLGSSTGIDFPFESTGYVGPSKPGTPGIAGKFMDLAIGQYDTYTTMQLAQYVSTIANDGYRLRPHLLKEAHNPAPEAEALGPVYQAQNPEVLNRLSMSDSKIKRVQNGFKLVFQSSQGTASRIFASKSYDAAGKTGTAENEEYDKNGKQIGTTENVALVGYAPYDDPEISFAVMVPSMTDGDSINLHIGDGVLQTYFDLEEERETGKLKEEDKSDVSDINE